MMTMMTCNDKYLQAHTEHVSHLTGECWLPQSISHEFTHHQFQFIKVSKSIFYCDRANCPVMSVRDEKN